MHQWLALAMFVVPAALLSGVLCGYVRKRLIKAAVLDTPNQRSLHSAPVPRGGGWGVWLSFFIMLLGFLLWPFVASGFDNPAGFAYFLLGKMPLVASMGILIFVSWRDDRKSLHPLLRFGAQLVAVCIGFMGFSNEGLVFQGLLPFWLDRAVTALAWLWFINLTNFMDGIDGITSIESIHIMGGLLLIGMLTMEVFPIYLALGFGAIIGFAFWNWHPAKLFLGDVGSIPLGFLMGHALIGFSMEGGLWIALVLPLYYVADATITLFKRLLRGEKFWHAHREHFYQKAALAVGRHDKVLWPIIACNAALLILCLMGVYVGPWPLLAAPLVVALLLWYLNRMAKTTVQ